jgi:hypothetical protein
MPFAATMVIPKKLFEFSEPFTSYGLDTQATVRASASADVSLNSVGVIEPIHQRCFPVLALSHQLLMIRGVIK